MGLKGKHFKKKEHNVKGILSNLFLIIFFICMIISINEIIMWLKNNKKTSEIINSINNVVTIREEQNLSISEKYNINFEELKNINSDTVGWLKVEGTDIEYPVVQGKDNSFYLKHTFDKTYNSAGWIFADYTNEFGQNKDKNIVIYGHNRRDGSMFYSLKDILKPEWYDNKEKKVIFITGNEESVYEPFSIYQIEQEQYYLTTKFKSKKDYAEFIENIKSRSIVDFEINVSEDDEIITLSTCANDNKYRVVLHAKKIMDTFER